MKTVSIQELKLHLSDLIAEASAGTDIVITRHKRPVARLAAADLKHLHMGPRFAKGRIAPLLRGKTKGRYLEVLDDDRRGGKQGR